MQKSRQGQKWPKNANKVNNLWIACGKVTAGINRFEMFYTFSMPGQREIAVFGGGCFWCTEAVVSELRGVVSVVPGYAGGTPPPFGKKPTYEEVCGGRTGHAEVIKIEFDPSKISFVQLLTVFFATHDPTTLNRQGNDVGTQYRSVILYSDKNQKRDAETFIKKLTASDPRGKPIVTEVKPLDVFYEAEDYHHNYFKNNQGAAYCQVTIEPKVQKLEKEFAELLKMHGKNAGETRAPVYGDATT